MAGWKHNLGEAMVTEEQFAAIVRRVEALEEARREDDTFTHLAARQLRKIANATTIEEMKAQIVIFAGQLDGRKGGR